MESFNISFVMSTLEQKDLVVDHLRRFGAASSVSLTPSTKFFASLPPVPFRPSREHYCRVVEGDLAETVKDAYECTKWHHGTWSVRDGVW